MSSHILFNFKLLLRSPFRHRRRLECFCYAFTAHSYVGMICTIWPPDHYLFTAKENQKYWLRQFQLSFLLNTLAFSMRCALLLGCGLATIPFGSTDQLNRSKFAASWRTSNKYAGCCFSFIENLHFKLSLLFKSREQAKQNPGQARRIGLFWLLTKSDLPYSEIRDTSSTGSSSFRLESNKTPITTP